MPQSKTLISTPWPELKSYWEDYALEKSLLEDLGPPSHYKNAAVVAHKIQTGVNFYGTPVFTMVNSPHNPGGKLGMYQYLQPILSQWFQALNDEDPSYRFVQCNESVQGLTGPAMYPDPKTLTDLYTLEGVEWLIVVGVISVENHAYEGPTALNAYGIMDVVNVLDECLRDGAGAQNSALDHAEFVARLHSILGAIGHTSPGLQLMAWPDPHKLRMRYKFSARLPPKY